MISKTRAVLRLAVQCLISSFINMLINVLLEQ